MTSSLFTILRGSTLGIVIRTHISNWNGYQQVPNPHSLDQFKSRLRELLSFVSNTLTMSSETKQKIKETNKRRNSKSNTVLLIGNGPSAASLTLEQLNHFKATGGSIAVMNSFFRTELASMIVPDYYFLIDRDFWSPQFENSKDEGKLIANYIRDFAPTVHIVQPASFRPIVANHKNFIYVDGRTIQGLRRIARPDKPWGLPSAVALYAIATLKFLGHSTILFTGLDSNFVSFYTADDLNRVVNKPQGMHSYKAEVTNENNIAPIDSRQSLKLPFRHLADLYYAHGIFLRDLYWLSRDRCVNVGNDSTNDSAPRGCLLPKS
jgi:hypothetical protein